MHRVNVNLVDGQINLVSESATQVARNEAVAARDAAGASATSAANSAATSANALTSSHIGTNNTRVGRSYFRWEASTGLTRAANGDLSLATGSTIRQDPQVALLFPEGAPGSFSCIIPRAGLGIWAAANVNQRTNSASISTHNFVDEGDHLALRNITLDPTCTILRVNLTNSSGSTISFGEPIFSSRSDIRVPAVDSDVHARDMLAMRAAAAETNLFSVISGATTNVGGATDGGSLTCPTGGFTEANLPLNVASGTPLTLLFETDVDPVQLGTGFTARIETGGAGGSGPSFNGQRVGPRLFAVRATFTTGNGNPATRMVMRIASPSEQVVCRNFWIVRGFELPPFIRPLGVVTAALAGAGIAPVFVDYTLGNDANAGTQAAPVKTFGRALQIGSDIRIWTGAIVRDVSGLAFGGQRLSVQAWRRSASDPIEARVRFAALHPYSGFTATAADPNVYFKAMATAPAALFEVNTTTDNVIEWTTAAQNGATTNEHLHPRQRLGVPNVAGSRTRQNIMAASEAAVRAAKGAWWHGAGSAGTGIYVRPTDDVITGKGVEVPDVAGLNGLTLTRVGLATFRSVQFEMGRAHCILNTGSHIELHGAGCSYAATNNGLGATQNDGGTIISNGGRYRWNQEDGTNVNGNVKLRHFGCDLSYNGGDGSSPHWSANDTQWVGCNVIGNGKQGLVSVGYGTHVFKDNICKDNADRDIYVQNDGAERTIVIAHGNHADEWQLQCTTAGNYGNWTFDLNENTGRLTIQGNATGRNRIQGHKAIATPITAGGSGLIVAGGNVDIDDFKIRGFSTGITNAGSGTVSPTNGHILRCTTTTANTGGGAIVWASANPVNLFANNDNAAPAGTVSFAAV